MIGIETLCGSRKTGLLELSIATRYAGANMKAVHVSIIRFIDEDQPGFVECQLFDAAGREWLFHEKVPVVTTELLWSDSRYPQPGVIACQVGERSKANDGREIVTIDTELPWGVEATNGQTRFEVFVEQLTDLAWH